MEEVLYDNAGVLLTAGADTYKVPGIYNILSKLQESGFLLTDYTKKIYRTGKTKKSP